MEFFAKLRGGAVHTAQLAIARYCIALEQQSGGINIAHAITQLNNDFRLVSPDQLNGLINDIELAYVYQKQQQIHEISRAGYWKFQASSAKDELARELQALVSPHPAN